MIRLLKMVGAAFALSVLPLLIMMGVEVESEWWGLAYGVGAGAAALTAVQLIKSVAVEQIVSARPKPIRAAKLSAAEGVDLAEWMADLDLDGPPVVVEHGPVKPPYGTPERAAHDRDVTS